MSNQTNDEILESIWDDVEEQHPEWSDEEKAIATNNIWAKMSDLALAT